MLIMLKKVLKLIGRAKTVDLDNDGKIETLRAEVEGVFSQFKRMADKLDSVNEQLDGVIADEEFAKECEKDNLERIIEEANRKMAEADKRVEKAQLEKQANQKLKEKVSEFIV